MGAPPRFSHLAQAAAEALQAAWEHRLESLGTALRGVTEVEAAYQAACYGDEEREEGWPAPGTILWQVAHVAHCKRYYATLLERRGTTERPEAAPRLPRSTLAEELAALRDAHDRQLEVVRSLEDADAGLRLPNGMSVPEFLSHQVRHDTWHAAQIVVARRLFRARARAAPSSA